MEVCIHGRIGQYLPNANVNKSSFKDTISYGKKIILLKVIVI